MKINGLNITVGADPEVFVAAGNGRGLPAYPYSTGTKKKPEVLEEGLRGDICRLQVDGMALEFNTLPFDGWLGFDRGIVKNLQAIESRITKGDFGHANNIISKRQTMKFSKKQYENTPEEHKELGCDPDFCAYTLEANDKPEPEYATRTAGGHIHIGWTEEADIHDQGHIEACVAIVKAMDYFFSLPMLFSADDASRRKLYGKAGCFRVKPYGVEYRTPSNFWIFKENFRKFAFTSVHRSVTEVFKQKGQFYCENVNPLERTDNWEFVKFPRLTTQGLVDLINTGLRGGDDAEGEVRKDMKLMLRSGYSIPGSAL